MSTTKVAPMGGPWSAWAKGGSAQKYNITGPSAAISHVARRAIDDNSVVSGCYAVIATASMKTPCLAIGETQEEADAHALFIADAGTTYHETGKTPSELAVEVASLKRRADCFDELVAALSGLVSHFDDGDVGEGFLDEANAALAKAAGETK